VAVPGRGDGELPVRDVPEEQEAEVQGGAPGRRRTPGGRGGAAVPGAAAVDGQEAVSSFSSCLATAERRCVTARTVLWQCTSIFPEGSSMSTAPLPCVTSFVFALQYVPFVSVFPVSGSPPPLEPAADSTEAGVHLMKTMRTLYVFSTPSVVSLRVVSQDQYLPFRWLQMPYLQRSPLPWVCSTALMSVGMGPGLEVGRVKWLLSSEETYWGSFCFVDYISDNSSSILKCMARAERCFLVFICFRSLGSLHGCTSCLYCRRWTSCSRSG
jgi:hypothetical protein